PSLLNRVEARSEATVFSRDQSVPVTPDDYLVLPNGDRWAVAGIPRQWNAVSSNWRPGIEIPARTVSARRIPRTPWTTSATEGTPDGSPRSPLVASWREHERSLRSTPARRRRLGASSTGGLRTEAAL